MRARRESRLRAFAAKLRGFLSRQQRDDGFDDEIQEHVRLLADRFVAQGMSKQEAATAARRQFGDTTLLRENRQELQTLPSIEAWWHDLRYALRTLRKRPGFTITAVLTLALGIGSNAAIFTIINAVLLRPLPFPHSERLVAVHTRFLPSSGLDLPVFQLSPAEFADVRSRVNAFAAIAAYGFENRNLARGNGEAERVVTMKVSWGFFAVLGVQPARGRTFTAEEGQPAGGCVALVSDEPSDRSPNAIGSTIRLDDAPCEVIGVMPQGFAFRDDRVKVWTAWRFKEESRLAHALPGTIARLREGVSAEQAHAQVQALNRYWSETYPEHYAKGHFALFRHLQEDLVGDQRDALLLLGGAVLLVLLIVCVNLAALLVSNGEARRREFAVRCALGANRRLLIQQLIAEAMVLAAAGAAVGVAFANTLLAGLLALYPQRLPTTQAMTIDSAAVLYTCVLVIVAGFVAGFVPALMATGAFLQEAMRTDPRSATSSRRAVATRSLLVISQLALSVIVLAGALLLIRSWQRLQQVDLGITPDRVLTFDVSIPRGRQPDAAAARRTMAAIDDRLAATPGLELAGAISDLPLASPGPADGFVIDGRPQPAPGAVQWNARYLMATPRMFPALGIRLMRGRLFADSDVAGRPLVAIVNETTAHRYWPGDDPIGKTIRYNPENSIHIVGIVSDVRSMGASEPAPPAIYVPHAQAPRPPFYEGRSMTFVVRTAGDPAAAAPSARAAVASIDPGLPLANVRPMLEVVSAAGAQPRFTTVVMSSFAGAAFLLAGLGLYGILAYSVEQRIREMGVRIALGAGRPEIFRLIVGSGMSLALVGVLVGIPAALAVTRLMRGVLSDVESTDSVTYGAVAAMVGIVAFLASYLPARRATRVDPLVALRTE
jgi:putative ABC transport system permease protein